jgi:hypothetical protein
MSPKKKKLTPKEIVEKRLARLLRALERIGEDTDDAVRRARGRAHELKLLLASEVKKDSLTFDEIRELPARWGGDPDTIFKGTRKFRLQDEDGRFEVERTKSEFTFYCRWRDHGASFRIPRQHIKELIEWLNE